MVWGVASRKSAGIASRNPAGISHPSFAGYRQHRDIDSEHGFDNNSISTPNLSSTPSLASKNLAAASKVLLCSRRNLWVLRMHQRNKQGMGICRIDKYPLSMVIFLSLMSCITCSRVLAVILHKRPKIEARMCRSWGRFHPSRSEEACLSFRAPFAVSLPLPPVIEPVTHWPSGRHWTLCPSLSLGRALFCRSQRPLEEVRMKLCLH